MNGYDIYKYLNGSEYIGEIIASMEDDYGIEEYKNDDKYSRGF